MCLCFLKGTPTSAAKKKANHPCFFVFLCFSFFLRTPTPTNGFDCKWLTWTSGNSAHIEQFQPSRRPSDKGPALNLGPVPFSPFLFDRRGSPNWTIPKKMAPKNSILSNLEDLGTRRFSDLRLRRAKPHTPPTRASAEKSVRLRHWSAPAEAWRPEFSSSPVQRQSLALVHFAWILGHVRTLTFCQLVGFPLSHYKLSF